MAGSNNKLQLVYGPDERPESIRDTLIYSLQWVLIMFYPMVWGYAIVGVGLGLSGDVLANYMARVAFVLGVSTLMQTIFGHRLSMISGPNIIPSLAIVSAYAVGGESYALLSFNAYIIAGIVVAILGFLNVFSYIGKVWTPLVLGSMIMTIGLVTSFTGMRLIASYQASWPYYVGIFLALMSGWLSIKGKGMLATIPVLITIVTGYAIFMIGGKFDWELVRIMPVFSIPKLFPFGMGMPPLDLIITMVIVNIFSAVNLYGNVEGYTNIIGMKVKPEREKKYFAVFGLIEGVFASIFGVPSNVAYGENLGFLLLTRVASRFLIIVASSTFIVLSFFGKVGGLMAAMPEPVAGAVLLGVASTLIGLGAQTMNQSEKFQTREIFIVGFSVFFALGTSMLPGEFFESIPRIAGTLLNNSVILVIILVMILEQVVFREKSLDKMNKKLKEE
ncbi:MAG: purine/pyrimidine permease [Gudongella sp.]|nr:purine/pyrimidine permease [Gudongella sp.]